VDRKRFEYRRAWDNITREEYPIAGHESWKIMKSSKVDRKSPKAARAGCGQQTDEQSKSLVEKLLKWQRLLMHRLTAGCLLIAMFALVEGCKPNVNSPDPKERIRALKNLTDQAVLARMAIEDKDESVRVAAFAKLTDQAALAKIAIEDKDESARVAAFAKLTDQAVLAKMAIENDDKSVRIAAIAKLTDQAVLFKIAITEYWEIRKAAIAKLTDQALLIEVIARLEGHDGEGCRAAVARLTDQAVLAKLASEDKISGVRIDAVNKLTDQRALAKIASMPYMGVFYDPPHDVAVGRLTDQALLAKVSIEAANSEIRTAAYNKLDSKTLASLSTASDPVTRRYASILSKIPKACESIPEKHRERLRAELMGMFCPLTDPLVSSELGEVTAITFSWESVSQSYFHGPLALGEKFTVSVALSKTDGVVSHSWITDFPNRVFWRMGEEHTQWFEAKVGSLDFPREICGLLSASTLAKVAIESERSILRYAAVERLTDQVLLAKIAAEDPDSTVRDEASFRLSFKK
jgi:hypothetical protein